MSIGPRTHAPLRPTQHMLLCAQATPPRATYHPTTRGPTRLTPHPAHPLRSRPPSCGTPNLPSHPPQPRHLHSLLATFHTSYLHTIPTGSVHEQHVTTHIDTVSFSFTIFIFLFLLLFFITSSAPLGWLFSLLLYGGLRNSLVGGAWCLCAGWRVVFFYFFYFLRDRLHAWLWSPGRLGKPLRLTFRSALGLC